MCAKWNTGFRSAESAVVQYCHQSQIWHDRDLGWHHRYGDNHQMGCIALQIILPYQKYPPGELNQ